MKYCYSRFNTEIEMQIVHVTRSDPRLFEAVHRQRRTVTQLSPSIAFNGQRKKQ